MSKTPKSVTRNDTRRELGNLNRRLPSIERVLSRSGVEALVPRYGREALTEAARAVLEELRTEISRGMTEGELDTLLEGLDDTIAKKLERELRSSLRPAINATGIIVHTNLGRAPLSARALEAVREVASGYSNLELDLGLGKRGSRHRHASHLLATLFPGKSALVVNNAAAAVMLALNTFAAGKEVVISRGELVEIGGSFRVPDILARSGARLREVGTTNKTRIGDYKEAIGPDTGVLLRVHPSNFRIVGFTESASTEELVRLGEANDLTVIEDFGSGNLLSLAAFGLPSEPTVHESLASGVHLSIFSGDKLLGGPQAGIVVGEPSRIEACRKNPMSRALRVDKLTYAALEATLLSFVEGKAMEEIPVLRMLSATKDEIRKRCDELIENVGTSGNVRLSVAPSTSRVGGGAAADAELETYALVLESASNSADQVLKRLREHDPPIIARISEDRVLIDLRTVAPEEESAIASAIRTVAERS